MHMEEAVCMDAARVLTASNQETNNVRSNRRDRMGSNLTGRTGCGLCAADTLAQAA
jgi:hypothetical protein